MLKLAGKIITNTFIYLQSYLVWGGVSTSWAISIDEFTTSISADEFMATKRVLNNNDSARLYQVSLYAIDKPGSAEHQINSPKGELLFSPKRLMLPAGQADFFKFYYHGPKDNQERYFRILFHEIPTINTQAALNPKSEINLAPIIVTNTILVIRPRLINFKWQFLPNIGKIKNTGNTWFKLINKTTCHENATQSQTWYLRPGEQIIDKRLARPSEKIIFFNDKMIYLARQCPDK